MRRILHVIDSLGYTGATMQLLALAEGLACRGFDVHIAALSESSRTALPFREACGEPGRAGPEEGSAAKSGPRIPVTYLPRRWRVDPLADVQLIRHVARLKPDVVHTWNCVPGMLGPIAVNWARTRRRRKQLVAEPTEGPRLVAGQYRIQRWPSEFESQVERRFARQAVRYLSNSTAVRDWCVTRGLRDQRFTVIPPGVPAAPASDVPRDALLRELNLPADARLIGVVGRLVPDSRVQDLIWAADLLRVLHDNLRVLIVGDGPLRSQLEQYARLASDLEHIRFLGVRSDLWRILPHFDVLWNGSENRSVSSSILEAMAAGVPVIASDVPVNRELVVADETGYVIPIGRRSGRADRARHTDRIFNDAALAARLGTAAKQVVSSRFNREQVVASHADLYSEVLKAGR
ncbi:MAG TPA: glycosyltransferase [Lacipirellulaceae bacterium]|nr:glycosyltransferase [Lacipirellulaceae bacterium]